MGAENFTWDFDSSTSQYQHQHTVLPTIWLAASIIELVVPTVLLPVRIYVRNYVVKIWTKSDTSFILCWALLVASVCLAIDLTRYGAGEYESDISAYDYAMFNKIMNAQQLVYMCGVAIGKTTILLQLEEVFAPSRWSARWWTIMGLITFTVVFYTIIFFIVMFQCSPRSKIWKSDEPGYCRIDIQVVLLVTAAINVVEDVIILFLPLFWISKLNMPKKRKWHIAAVFAVGAAAVICSIMRLIEDILHMTSEDTTRTVLPASLWATAEIATCLIVAILPHFPKFITLTSPLNNLKRAFTPRFHCWRNRPYSSASSRNRQLSSLFQSGTTQTDVIGTLETSNGTSVRNMSEAHIVSPNNSGRMERARDRITRTFSIEQYFLSREGWRRSGNA